MTDQYIVLVVGPQGSGKSHLSRAIVEACPGLAYVSGDDERFRLKETDKFKDIDYTRKSLLQHEANALAKRYVRRSLKDAVISGGSVLLDSTGLRPTTRAYRIEEAKALNPNIKTIIVGMATSDSVIKVRLVDRDNASPGSRWLSNYYEYVRDTYSRPRQEEADLVLLADVENTDECVSSVSSLLN